MKKNNLVEIKKMEMSAITTKLESLRKDLSDGVLDKNMDKAKNAKGNWKIRKEIAVYMTILNQKKLLAAFDKQEKGDAKEVV